MNSSDIKLEIFRHIDSLDKSRLEELYGVLLNFLNGKSEISEWDNMPKDYKNGIIEAIDEIDKGEGIPHENVLREIRMKYKHG